MFLLPNDSSMVRIAVFIDGGYFDEVSRYYKFQHRRQSRLDIVGIQEFMRHAIAQRRNVDVSYCQIVEAHYFRGRFSTEAAIQAGKVEDERRFDEILMRAGIVQHYLPLQEGRMGQPVEKGIDVWLSLEAYDLAVHKKFDVLGLVACDGDYVPLVRKLNGIGTSVMLLAWDFEYDFEWNGSTRHKETRTNGELINVSTYPVHMNSVIDDRSRNNDPSVNALFVR